MSSFLIKDPNSFSKIQDTTKKEPFSKIQNHTKKDSFSKIQNHTKKDSFLKFKTIMNKMKNLKFIIVQIYNYTFFIDNELTDDSNEWKNTF